MLGSVGTMRESEATMDPDLMKRWHGGRTGLNPAADRTGYIAPWFRAQPECSCGSEGPDSFGNYDRIPNPECPIHEK